MKQFFVNFGGPRKHFTDRPGAETEIISACTDYYEMEPEELKLQIEGVIVSLFSFGDHKTILVKLPDDANQNTSELFESAERVAINFCRNKKYCHLVNNCVTAVAHVLHALNPEIVQKETILPCALDNYLMNYQGENNVGISKFILQYNVESGAEYFSLFRRRYWHHNKINSMNDIIEHANSKTEGFSGERTRTSLLKLNWIQRTSQGTLEVTDSAPLEFRMAWENKHQNSISSIEDPNAPLLSLVECSL